MRGLALLRRLAADQHGTMLIETALIAPVLVLLCLGAFQVSGIVARQTELEGAAAEAAAIALAAKPDTVEERTTLRNVIVASTSLSSNQVTVSEAYRCGTGSSYKTAKTSCTSGQVSSYVQILLTDTYTPAWTKFGVGSPITFRVRRYVLFAQESAV
jgi:Flp pilus assembly protein TadG